MWVDFKDPRSLSPQDRPWSYWRLEGSAGPALCPLTPAAWFFTLLSLFLTTSTVTSVQKNLPSIPCSFSKGPFQTGIFYSLFICFSFSAIQVRTALSPCRLYYWNSFTTVLNCPGILCLLKCFVCSKQVYLRIFCIHCNACLQETQALACLLLGQPASLFSCVSLCSAGIAGVHHRTLLTIMIPNSF